MTSVANCRRYQWHRRQICHQYQRHRWQILPSVPPVLLTPVANFPPVTTAPEANCHRYQRHRWQICHQCHWHRWQIMGTISGCRHMKVNMKAKNYIYVFSTTQIMKISMIDDFFHLPPVSLTLVANLKLQISLRIFEKIWNCSGANVRVNYLENPPKCVGRKSA